MRDVGVQMIGRLVYVEVSPEVVLSLLTGDHPCYHPWTRITTDLPSSVELRGMDIDMCRNTIRLFLEHESFDEVHEGDRIPERAVTFRSD